MNTDNFCLVFVGQAFLPDFLFAFFPKARFSIAGTLVSAGECLRYRWIFNHRWTQMVLYIFIFID